MVVSMLACGVYIEASEGPFIVPRPKQIQFTGDRVPLVRAGTIAYASSRTKAGRALAAKLGKEGDFEHPAFGLSRELLLNGARWLCGG